MRKLKAGNEVSSSSFVATSRAWMRSAIRQEVCGAEKEGEDTSHLEVQRGYTRDTSKCERKKD